VLDRGSAERALEILNQAGSEAEIEPNSEDLLILKTKNLP
jgi:hypothetical protein